MGWKFGPISLLPFSALSAPSAVNTLLFMLTVHLRIADAATKKPVPCRLRISDSAGNYFAPLGRLAVFACGVGEDVGGSIRLGRDNFAHIDGSCEVVLPASVPLRIQAFRG